MSNSNLIGDKTDKDIAFLRELASWLEDKDAEYSDLLYDTITRYEIVSGAYLSRLRSDTNQKVEQWKMQNL